MAFAESFRAARWIRTVNLILQAILLLTFFGGLNYLALYTAWGRFDLTKMRKHSLSPETLSYLSQLKKQVIVVSTMDQNAEDEKYRLAYEDVNQLIREYLHAMESNNEGKIRFTNLDPNLRPKDAQLLGVEQNQILVNCDGRNRLIRFEELYQFKQGQRSAFLGEEAITTAILDVANTNRNKIYFVVGHGELEPKDVSPTRGLSIFADNLSIRNFELDTLDLRVQRKVPDDASLLIIAQPASLSQPAAPFERYEEELLRDYLKMRAGRVLLFLGPGKTQFGLDDLLYDWGVLALPGALIYDSSPAGQSEGGLMVNGFAPHPITRPLLDQNLPLSLGICRNIHLNPSREADETLSVQRIIGPGLSSENTAWGEKNFSQSPPRRDPDDLSGKGLGVAVVSERVGAKAHLEFSVPRGRLVVFGTSDLINNARINQRGNKTAALSTVNWLVDRDPPLSIAPRPIEKLQLALSQDELLRLRYTLLFALPGAAALLGIIVYWTRRR